jgi:flagellar hook-basal body complex protein FliE
MSVVVLLITADYSASLRQQMRQLACWPPAISGNHGTGDAYHFLHPSLPAHPWEDPNVDVRFPASALKAAADAAAAAARGVTPPAGVGGVKPAGAIDGGFSSVLHGALADASAAQQQATRLQQDFQAGVNGATLEQTMVAMQKGQIAFQSAVTVRNRLVSAYTDIMNMQV